MIVLRLLHVVLGALWVGFAVFLPFLLMPAMTESGPDGGRVMGALQRRGLMTILPWMAIVTIISGFWMYWRVSEGFQPSYMGSRPGMVIGLGAVFAVAAFVLGMAIGRPAMMKAASLMQALPRAASDAERQALMATIQRLRERGSFWGRVNAVLLLLALAAMAVARYA